MAPPKRGRKRTVVYLSPEFKAALLEESKRREIPMGDLIEEAYAQRVKLVRR